MPLPTGRARSTSIPVFKHFPGIGRATRNTDAYKVVIGASKTTLNEDLYPFRHAMSAGGAPMLMLSNATYTAWDSANGAGWSKAIGSFLRHDLGYTGVTITDSLSGQPATYGLSLTVIAARACRAGTDMVMLTGSEGSTAKTYNSLLALAGSGSIARATLQTSYDRIVALKSTL